MPWFKVDDAFHSHPKVMELTTGAVGLWTLAGAWCADYLTDGEIRKGQLRRLGGTDEEASQLVEAGLWIPTEDGYRFRDWHDYQPTRESVEAERDAARERQRKRREQQEAKRRNRSSVTDDSQRDTDVTHANVTEEFVAPVPEPAPEVPNGTSITPPAADADGQSETTSSFELDHPEPPEPTAAELFKRFWSAYPRKDDKGKALEKFKAALNRADAEQIIAGAERYRDDPNRDPGYTKLPTTWLNADAWDNGPLPPRHKRPASGSEARMDNIKDIIARRMPAEHRNEITQ